MRSFKIYQDYPLQSILRLSILRLFSYSNIFFLFFACFFSFSAVGMAPGIDILESGDSAMHNLQQALIKSQRENKMLAGEKQKLEDLLKKRSERLARKEMLKKTAEQKQLEKEETLKKMATKIDNERSTGGYFNPLRPMLQAHAQLTFKDISLVADRVENFLAEVEERGVVENMARATEDFAETNSMAFASFFEARRAAGLPITIAQLERYNSMFGPGSACRSAVVGAGDVIKEMGVGEVVCPMQADLELEGEGIKNALLSEGQIFWKNLYPNLFGFLVIMNGKNFEGESKGAVWARNILQGNNGVDSALKIFAELGGPRSQFTEDWLVFKKRGELNMAILAGRLPSGENGENGFLENSRKNIDAALSNVETGSEALARCGNAVLEYLDEIVVLDAQGNPVKNPTLGQKLKSLFGELGMDGEERLGRLFDRSIDRSMGRESWVGQIGKLIAVGVSIAIIIACKKAFDAFGGAKKIRKDFISFVRELAAEVARGGDINSVTPEVEVKNKDVSVKDTENKTENNKTDNTKNSQKDNKKGGSKAQEQLAQARVKRRPA